MATLKFTPHEAKDPKTYPGLRVWRKPQPTQVYAIGADVAEGVGGDASCAQVIDVSTGLLVASYWSNHIDVDNYAAELYKLGKWYNLASICVESNNHGIGVLSHLGGSLGGLAYPNLYRRYVLDEYTQKRTKQLGFKTTVSTKPRIIENLKSAVRDGELLILDKYTILEMNSFVRDERTGKLGAKGKGRDDRVMALALAWEQARLLAEAQRGAASTQPEQRYDSMTGFPLSQEKESSEQEYNNVIESPW